MAKPVLTKLSWSKRVAYVPKGATLLLEVNNSVLRREGEPKEEAFGRKPYLISKEYVLPGEEYDYLAMMSTKWSLGENNSWVVNRKPYEHKDYHLMLTGWESVGEAMEEYYPTKFYLAKMSDSSKGLSIENVRDWGSTTTAYVKADADATGLYYLYAEDNRGNKISTFIGSSVALIQRNDLGYPPPVYVLYELIDSKENPYLMFTDAPEQQFLVPMGGSYTYYLNSWSNADGYGTDWYYTYSLSDNVTMLSTSVTLSYASVSLNKTETTQSGVWGDMGATPPYIYEIRNHTSRDLIDGAVWRNIVINTISNLVGYYEYSGGPSFIVTSPYSYSYYKSNTDSPVVTFGGEGYTLQYLSTDFYVYTMFDYSLPTSYPTRYSGMYDNKSFAFSVGWQGTTVFFGYV